jgi:hypothetical protein
MSSSHALNIKLGWKWLKEINTLAYYVIELIMPVKSLKVKFVDSLFCQSKLVHFPMPKTFNLVLRLSARVGLPKLQLKGSREIIHKISYDNLTIAPKGVGP